MGRIRADKSSTANLDASHGCLSDLSTAALDIVEHDCASAIKSYSTVYADYQAYLMPREHLISHDYDLAARPTPSVSHIGCLNVDLFDATLPSDDVNDDDIERCGYAAWVHH